MLQNREECKDKRAKSILWFFSGSMCWAKRKEGKRSLFHLKPSHFSPLGPKSPPVVSVFIISHSNFNKKAVRCFADRKIFNQTQLPPLSLLLQTNTHKTNLSSDDNCDFIVISPFLNPDLTNLAWTPPANEALWVRWSTYLYRLIIFLLLSLIHGLYLSVRGFFFLHQSSEGQIYWEDFKVMRDVYWIKGGVCKKMKPASVLHM